MWGDGGNLNRESNIFHTEMWAKKKKVPKKSLRAKKNYILGCLPHAEARLPGFFGYFRIF